MRHGFVELMLQRLLDPARHAGDDRLIAPRRIAKLFVECALDARIPLAVDIGVADDMGRKAELRVEPVGLALQRQSRFAE